MPSALGAARAAVPEGRFVEGFLPCPLPDAPEGYDVILLSRVLYFVGRDAIRDLARRIDADHPGADVVTATWRGPTGHALRGDAAFVAFSNATLRTWRTPHLCADVRIAVFAPLRAPAA